jgi:hypothetical protein
MRTLLSTLLIFCCMSNAAAQARALDDSELALVAGGEGISIAMHLALNDPALANPGADSRLAFGFDVDGKKTYLVFRNLRGMIDMFGLKLDIASRPDGGDYSAITLPVLLKFNNFGFDSFSAQADPLAPVTESLGRVNINGSLSMQGQLRLWAH